MPGGLKSINMLWATKYSPALFKAISMRRQRHPRYCHSFIDSCAFNPVDNDEYTCSRKLLAGSDDGDFMLIVAHSVQKEIDHPNTPGDIKRLSSQAIFTLETNLTSEELVKRDEIRALVRGNAKLGRHESDADHIFELHKYGGGYFITTDNRLLSRSKELFSKYFVTTIKPTDFELVLKSDT
jgi:hypothetical protein